MPYVGGSLTSLFDRGPQRVTKLVPGRVVRRGADRMHDVAAANTPVRTGNLRTAWYQLPVVEVDYLIGKASRGGIQNDTDYAAYVESGTGIYGPQHRPYKIRPKDPTGFLVWRGKDGQLNFAKEVNHPGSPGNHMLAIAAHVVEAELYSGALSQAILDEWARAVEGMAD